ncbi:MAG: SDR family NAD(P)-dependent oxidoreductase [Desulfobacterales bacterium]|nr:SDR family NAD(P)-dependent oxidoreductase [Desulfobacterales bacterium]
MADLNQQIVIITGGAQGIGKGIARYLLKKGAGVVIADIDREAGRECVSEFKNPKNLFFIRTDVSDEKSVAACIRNTIKKSGYALYSTDHMV